MLAQYKMELNKEGLPILVKEKETDYGNQEVVINTPQKVVSLINKAVNLENQAEEHLYIIAFDIRLKPKGIFEVTHGSVSQSVFSPREIFQRAFMVGASNIAMIHNHPSGDVTPSIADNKSYQMLKDAGKIMNINVFDSIIIGKDKYYSYTEEEVQRWIR